MKLDSVLKTAVSCLDELFNHHPSLAICASRADICAVSVDIEQLSIGLDAKDQNLLQCNSVLYVFEKNDGRCGNNKSTEEKAKSSGISRCKQLQSETAAKFDHDPSDRSVAVRDREKTSKKLLNRTRPGTHSP